MTIHLNTLGLEIMGGAVIGFIIGTICGIFMIADDTFLPIPFTHDKIHGGCKLWTVPEPLIIIGWFVFFFPSIIAFIVGAARLF